MESLFYGKLGHYLSYACPSQYWTLSFTATPKEPSNPSLNSFTAKTSQPQKEWHSRHSICKTFSLILNQNLSLLISFHLHEEVSILKTAYHLPVL